MILLPEADFFFSMCSAPDSYDIALAADGLDICESMFDGDGTTPNYNQKLDYSKTFAFSILHLAQTLVNTLNLILTPIILVNKNMG